MDAAPSCLRRRVDAVLWRRHCTATVDTALLQRTGHVELLQADCSELVQHLWCALHTRSLCAAQVSSPAVCRLHVMMQADGAPRGNTGGKPQRECRVRRIDSGRVLRDSGCSTRLHGCECHPSADDAHPRCGPITDDNPCSSKHHCTVEYVWKSPVSGRRDSSGATAARVRSGA
jgi:hypothetical protein